MMLGLLLARAGVRVIVLEKHRDFLRDFRGDTIHPSTLRLFDELGLLGDLLSRGCSVDKAEEPLRFAPDVAAVVVYLQISGVGPMLGSGFWLIATERFDPHTAKRRFGQIAALDLELRGAGSMLGGEQSGQVDAIGFELYTSMLERTVRELRTECRATKSAFSSDATRASASSRPLKASTRCFLSGLSAAVQRNTLCATVKRFLNRWSSSRRARRRRMSSSFTWPPTPRQARLVRRIVARDRFGATWFGELTIVCFDDNRTAHAGRAESRRRYA